MLLQPSSLLNHRISISSAGSYSRQLPCRIPKFILSRTPSFQKLPITCSISQVHSYGTVDFERRPMVKWNALYKKISLMENPELGSASVLNEWEKGGRKLTKWEFCRVVKELRKYKRFKQALEVTQQKKEGILCSLIVSFDFWVFFLAICCRQRLLDSINYLIITGQSNSSLTFGALVF